MNYATKINNMNLSSELEEKLIKDDILIRNFGGKLNNYYRVTIGSKKENKVFLESMKKLV